jgi:hypothetical protein
LNLCLKVDLVVIILINNKGSPTPMPTPRVTLSETLSDEAIADVVEFPGRLGSSEPKTDDPREGKEV